MYYGRHAHTSPRYAFAVSINSVRHCVSLSDWHLTVAIDRHSDRFMTDHKFSIHYMAELLVAEGGIDPFVGIQVVRATYMYTCMDVIHRLEPIVIEIQRERECMVVVVHQAILRALYGYFMKIPLKVHSMLQQANN